MKNEAIMGNKAKLIKIDFGWKFLSKYIRGENNEKC